MKKLIVVAVLTLCVCVYGEVKFNELYFRAKTVDVQLISMPDCIVLYPGGKQITINLKTGRVNGPGYVSAEAAAKLFWDAVVTTYPEVKAQIKAAK